MAATKSQGSAFGVFVVGVTVAGAGIATFSSGGGKAAFFIGLVLLFASFFMFHKLKPLEGKVALGSQPSVQKLIGAILALLGWIIVLFGIHLTSGVGGRMATSLIGLAVSLVGILVVLPAASNKNAIWKA
jgi:hypothetical protein